MKIINKIITLLTAVIMILILVGLVFSSSVRNNLIVLFESLYHSGSIGILVAIWLIWSFWSAPKTIKKLHKAGGFNSKWPYLAARAWTSSRVRMVRSSVMRFVPLTGL